MSEPLVGIYPGTFDPITNGHTDVIQRAARMLDKLVVGVAINAGKGPLFSLEERLEMVRVEAAAMGEVGNRIEVQGFDNLLVDFAKDNGATVIIRGLRAVTDFDYEFQMASMNAKLAPDVETVCLMASDRHQFIASRLVKEIAILNGDVAQFVSPRVRELLEEKVKNR
ncbi:MAG: pantetheine-phosphate adenylyltransferase [Alphaproteobacteria bacterium]|nr:pantetheine-phosphate adenylyltransferase [Alphaproteobacteria bacterium]